MSFPKVDMRNGYHNGVGDEQSRKYLGFKFEGQHFRYKRMPMGVSNGPYFFNLFIGQILKELPPEIYHLVRYYVDDVVIVGSTTLSFWLVLKALRD